MKCSFPFFPLFADKKEGKIPSAATCLFSSASEEYYAVLFYRLSGQEWNQTSFSPDKVETGPNLLSPSKTFSPSRLSKE